MIIHISNDLMFGSKIRGAAANQGLAYQSLMSVPSESEDDKYVKLVLIDLSCVGGPNVESVHQQVKVQYNSATVIGYCGHVKKLLLDEARNCGMQVMTNGQLNEKYQDMIKNLV